MLSLFYIFIKNMIKGVDIVGRGGFEEHFCIILENSITKTTKKIYCIICFEAYLLIW